MDNFVRLKRPVMKFNSLSLTLTLALALLAGAGTTTHAQFNDGDNVLGAGVGVLGGYHAAWFGSGYYHSPAFHLHLDHGMGELGPGSWGLGGYVGLKTSGYRERLPNYRLHYRYTFLVVGVRGTWHYNDWHGVDGLDTYGGAMLAFSGVFSRDVTDYGTHPHVNYGYHSSGGGLGLGLFLGTRYYFTDQFGIYGELGYGLTWLQAGLAVRL